MGPKRSNFFEAARYEEAARGSCGGDLCWPRAENIDATLAYAAARFATGDYQISALAVRRAVRRMPEVVNSTFDVRERYGDPNDFNVHLIRLEAYLRDNPRR